MCTIFQLDGQKMCIYVCVSEIKSKLPTLGDANLR